MGILKIVSDSKRKKSNDPPASISFSISHDLSYQRVEPNVPHFWKNVLFTLIFGTFFFSFLYVWSSKSRDQKEKEYAYFEIHVTNQQSQPVVGAKIYNKTNLVGVTDLYGQWRRFMKVKPKSRVSFVIKKDHLSVKKNFTIPDQLSQTTKKSRFFTKVQIDAKGSGKIYYQPLSNIVSDQQQKYEKVWIYVSEAENYVALDDGVKISQLKQYVIPNIKSILEKEGISIDRSSDWKISIAHVEDPLGRSSGLIRVKSNQIFSSEDKKNDKEVDFLMNYTGNGEKTAQNLLSKLKYHLRYPYLVKKQKNSWYGIQPESDFWSITSDQYIQKDDQQKILAKPNEDVSRFFSIEDENPCPNGKTECELFSVFPDQIKSIHITGYDSSVDVFVSGIKATFENPSIWKFVPFEDENPYLTILQGNVILERQPFSQQKDISFQKKQKNFKVR